MAGKPKRILFIAHEASLSGSIFVLLELMKWLKAHEQIEMALLLKGDGPVKGKFEETCPVYLYDFQPKQYGNRVISAIYRRLIWPRQKERHRNKILGQLRQNRFDMIYANTMGVGEILNFLNPLNCTVISHIHELQYVIECTGSESMKATVDATSYYVVVCEDIKNLLQQNYGVDSAKILVVPECINFAKIDHEKDEADVKTQLKIGTENFVIGGSGSVEWRKGVDLFVEVAIQVLARFPASRFIWTGSPRESGMMAKLNYDIKKAGLEKSIQFIGPYKNPYPYYQIFDLFLLTSREDPYPLVCIENMYLNSPVICFDRSGGAVSLISKYRFGKPVSYLDVSQMAETVIEYIKNRDTAFPAIDIKRLKEEHSVETIAPKIFQAISNLL